VIRAHDIAGAASEFISTQRKMFHAFVLLTVFLCLLDHGIEALTGWDQKFLQTGRDTETTLLLVFLLLGLAFALAAQIRVSARLPGRRESVLALLHLATPSLSFGLAVRPDSSPPLTLRI
jgi:hypothetical protein